MSIRHPIAALRRACCQWLGITDDRALAYREYAACKERIAALDQLQTAALQSLVASHTATFDDVLRTLQSQTQLLGTTASQLLDTQRTLQYWSTHVASIQHVEENRQRKLRRQREANANQPPASAPGAAVGQFDASAARRAAHRDGVLHADA